MLAEKYHINPGRQRGKLVFERDICSAVEQNVNLVKAIVRKRGDGFLAKNFSTIALPRTYTGASEFAAH